MGKTPRFLAIFSTVLLLGWAFLSPAAYHSKPFNKRKIALTFDDGPRPYATRRLSKALKRNGAVATFFIVGQIAAAHPEVIKSLFQDGHEIANHTWSHSELKTMSPADFVNELEGTRHFIKELTGQDTYLFRTPGSTEKFIRGHFVVPPKYTLILWDVHSLDQERLSAKEIAERIESQAKDGDIVLMHNGIKATVKALDFLIPELQSRGFEFTTISGILKYRQKFLTTSIERAVIRG